MENNIIHNVSSLPDMNKILLHFGIKPSNLKTVPLRDYDWSNMVTCVSPEDLDSPTISQRIKSLVRGARRSKTEVTNSFDFG